ncbi:unnamed protein product [Owenia fusiformis]|uniref:Uncharacterized protein n=1 Tax=Owenia fusiformis TaxID=6347 RepID=A0A8J1TE56_OWEFU|nr:unnamed protein product [Owenia fusiformis]
MFGRRDIPPVILLLFVIILVMCTLSQIIVVHQTKHMQKFRSAREIHAELREMDRNLRQMMRRPVPSLEHNRKVLINELNQIKIRDILKQAEERNVMENKLVPNNVIYTDRNLKLSKMSKQDPKSNVVEPYTEKINSQNISVSRNKDENNNVKLVLSRIADQSSILRSSGLKVNNNSLEPLTSSQGKSQANEEVTNVINSQPDRSKDISTGGIDHYLTPTQSLHTSSHRKRKITKSRMRKQTAQTETNPHHPSLRTIRISDYDYSSKIRKTALETSSIVVDYNAKTFMNITNDTVTAHQEDTKIDRRQTTDDHHINVNTTKPDVIDPINYCPEVPPNLVGRVFLDLNHTHDLTGRDIIDLNPEVKFGGQWRPHHCTARHRVAVIVPYRDRESHLTVLLSHLHPILQRQLLDYRIYVVEQAGQKTFNKAQIMNAAFLEALRQYNFQCFVFHDVDLVPEDDRNMYSCPIQPRHMSMAIDEMGYKLAYDELVGGVLNMRTEHFLRVNGYSNLYWGWGAEDDDMAYRIMHVGLKIIRPPEMIARYKMIRHTKRSPSDWRKRTRLLYTGTRRYRNDGLNNLEYKLSFVKEERLFTHIMVQIGEPPPGFDDNSRAHG